MFVFEIQKYMLRRPRLWDEGEMMIIPNIIGDLLHGLFKSIKTLTLAYQLNLVVFVEDIFIVVTASQYTE